MIAVVLVAHGIGLFPVAFPVLSTIGALAVDVAVLAAATWRHWLPTDPSP